MPHLTYLLFTTRSKETNKIVFLENNGIFSFFVYYQSAFGADYYIDQVKKHLSDNLKLNLSDLKIERIESVEAKYNSPPITVCRIDIEENTIAKLKDIDNYFGKVRIADLSSNRIKYLKNWEENQLWFLKKIGSGEVYFKEEILDHLTINYIENLSNEHKSGNLLIFVGAGISIASGLPSWNQLIDSMKQELDIDLVNKEVIALLYLQKFGSLKYWQKIETLLSTTNKSPNIIHKSIFELQPSEIVTTNYDDLLETAANESLIEYKVVASDNDLTFLKNYNKIIKMHGDLATKNIILTEKDYNLYKFNFPIIYSYILSKFTQKTILFIGFSLEDRNLKFILDILNYHLKENQFKAFIFYPNTDSKKNEIIENYFESINIRIIKYNSTIDKLLKLEGYRNHLDDSNKKTLNTAKFLQLIKLYNNSDKYLYKNTNIIDKLYSALIPYEDLPSIPPFYFESMLPFAFNNDISARYEYLGFHLSTSSLEVIDLFSSISHIKENKVLYKNGNRENDLLKNQKLIYIFEKLICSNIFCIKGKDIFIDTQHNHNKLKYFPEECNCLKCLEYRNELNTLQIAIDIHQLNDETDILKLLKKGAILYSFDLILEAYYTFKKSSTLAFKNRNYHFYFISIINLSKVIRRIKYLHIPNEINENLKYQIDHIDQFAITQIIEKSRLSSHSKKIIQSINIEEFGNMVENIMRNNIKEIELNYRNFKKGDTRIFSSNKIRETLDSYIAYFNFVNQNCLLELYEYRFSELTSLAFQSMLYSIQTEDGFPNKINELENTTLHFTLKYLAPSELDRILQFTGVNTSYKIEKIDELVEFVICFLKSHYQVQENIFSDATIEPTKLTRLRDENFVLNQRLSYYFENFIIIFKHSKEHFISSPHFEKLVESILSYLEVNKQSISVFNHNLIILVRILSHELRNKKLLNELYKFILNTNYENDSLIKEFCNSVSNLFLIDNINFNFDNIKRFIHEKYEDIDSIKSVSNFYKFCNSENKLILLELIDKHLNIQDNFYFLYRREIHLEEAFTLIKKAFIEKLEKEPKIDNIGNRKILHDRDFFNFFTIIADSIEKFDYIFEKPNLHLFEFYSWLIQPNNFNYDKFNIDWLYCILYEPAILKYTTSFRIEELKKCIENEIKNNYSTKLNEVYWKYFH